MKVILDTNVVSLFTKRANRALQLIEELNITETFITTITYIEFLAARLEDKLRIKRFLTQFTIAEFDEHTQRSAHYLCMRHQMKTKQAADFLIASVAHAKSYTVITDNLKDFAVKQDVTIIRYTAS